MQHSFALHRKPEIIQRHQQISIECRYTYHSSNIIRIISWNPEIRELRPLRFLPYSTKPNLNIGIMIRSDSLLTASHFIHSFAGFITNQIIAKKSHNSHTNSPFFKYLSSWRL